MITQAVRTLNQFYLAIHSQDDALNAQPTDTPLRLKLERVQEQLHALQAHDLRDQSAPPVMTQEHIDELRLEIERFQQTTVITTSALL